MPRILLVTSIAVLTSCAHDHGSAGPPDMVTGRVYQICRHVPADVELPSDLSTSVIQAWISDADPTGYRVSTGTGMADGTFTIPDVPAEGSYLLSIDQAYYVTDQHTVDLHTVRSGRCMPDPVIAQTSTPVTLALTHMTPYSMTDLQADRLEVDSFALDYRATVLARNVVPGDATHPTIAEFDWVQGRAPLLDAAAGDDLHVFHLRADRDRDPATQRARVMTHLVDQLDATGAAIQAGAPAMIEGAFTPVVANRTATFSIDRAAFDAGYTGATGVIGMTITVQARPTVPSTHGVTLAGFDFRDPTRAPSATASATSYAYADPFPASWQRFVTISYTRGRAFQFPAIKLQSTFVAGISQTALFDGAIAPAPVLLPPSGIRVGGTDFDAGGQVAFDGQAPVTVRWDPAPGAQVYQLFIQRMGADVRDPFSVTFTTADTSLQIPAAVFAGELFVSGAYYHFSLVASQSPTNYAAGQLVVAGFPSQSAIAISGRFRFLAHCGDGIVQPFEEECDTAGESATCNVDCTKPLCGDGLRNAAAGEACDSGGDSAGCNSDCTAARCGDGHFNRNTEDCDDGNTVDDGNGCTADCKFNNVCGNGRVESQAEQCDPGAAGETAQCNSDCTTSRCGDGHLNRAAGEECDLGSLNGTGSCSTTCKLP